MAEGRPHFVSEKSSYVFAIQPFKTFYSKYVQEGKINIKEFKREGALIICPFINLH